MPDLGPLGRGGARRRTRRRMTAVNSAADQEDEKQDFAESGAHENNDTSTDTAEKLEKLAKLLIDKGVITQSEFDLLFG